MLTPEACEVFSASMYHPTPEKYASAAEDWLSDPGTHCFGAYEGDELLGILVVRGGDILGIAVREDARRRGIGRKLILHALSLFPILSAETDADSVGFYRACGFVCTSFERTFPDGTVLRYRCERNT